jgi:hypothetical protein
MTQVNTTISNLRLPLNLTGRIRDFVIANQDGLDSQNELKTFMSMVSPSLRMKVTNYDFYAVVQKQDIFGFDQRIVDKVLVCLKIKFEKPGERVI